jgi:hypothetical protein
MADYGDRKVLKSNGAAVLLERKHCDYVVADADGGGRAYFLYPTRHLTQLEALAKATDEYERRSA